MKVWPQSQPMGARRREGRRGFLTLWWLIFEPLGLAFSGALWAKGQLSSDVGGKFVEFIPSHVLCFHINVGVALEMGKQTAQECENSIQLPGPSREQSANKDSEARLTA